MGDRPYQRWRWPPADRAACSYSEAQLRGRVTERRRDSDFKYIDAVSHKYVGKAWPYREETPVALVIEIDKVHYSKQPFEHTPTAAMRKPA